MTDLDCNWSTWMQTSRWDTDSYFTSNKYCHNCSPDAVVHVETKQISKNCESCQKRKNGRR